VLFVVLLLGLCPVSRAWRWWFVWHLLARFPRLKPWVKASASAVCVLFVVLLLGLCPVSRGGRLWCAWFLVSRFPTAEAVG
jgi:hypothetical protein